METARLEIDGSVATLTIYDKDTIDIMLDIHDKFGLQGLKLLSLGIVAYIEDLQTK